MKKNHLMIMVCILAVGLISGCSKTFNKTFGVPGEEDVAYSVQQTKDGGYILAGYTNSFGAGFYDAWLIKTNANGNKVWDKTFGGIGYDVANAVQQTSDGGYILAGYTVSFGAGSDDAWLIKTDASGETCDYSVGGNCYENESKWVKTFGGLDIDTVCSVQQTSDGGYIIAGNTKSLGAGGGDGWLIKTDSSGNKLWDKTYGGSEYDSAQSVQQTSDDGYIIAGNTESLGAGGSDAWLIETDSSGNRLWDKTFGGSKDDAAHSVQQTSDGGYIIAGNTRSLGAGGGDGWLIKTDSSGNKLWDKTFGGSKDEYAQSVQQTSDGGYIIAGSTRSLGAGDSDAWLIKTDANGEIQD